MLENYSHSINDSLKPPFCLVGNNIVYNGWFSSPILGYFNKETLGICLYRSYYSRILRNLLQKTGLHITQLETGPEYDVW